MNKCVILNKAFLARALEDLADRDPALAGILEELGPPPLWARPRGFPTLLRIILEQQVSLASAKAAFEKLLAIASPLTPESFLRLDDAALKAAGFSRQKASYGRYLARDISSGNLDLRELSNVDDAEARSRLIRVKGIGTWTADIYLLMALRRPDVWPAGDLALAVAARQVLGLSSNPGPDRLARIGARWKPWRAVAARLLWHHYLSGNGRRIR
jgi:DNA-3-methyladenine glycosylase II